MGCRQGLGVFLLSAAVYNFVPEFVFNGRAHSLLPSFLPPSLPLFLSSFLPSFPSFLPSFLLHFLRSGGSDSASVSLTSEHQDKVQHVPDPVLPCVGEAVITGGRVFWLSFFSVSTCLVYFVQSFYVYHIHSSQPQTRKARYRELLPQIRH